jgi:hypothetical protein
VYRVDDGPLSTLAAQAPASEVITP